MHWDSSQRPARTKMVSIFVSNIFTYLNMKSNLLYELVDVQVPFLVIDCYSSYNNFEKDVLNLSCFPQKLANKIYSDFPGYPNLIHQECFQLNVANNFSISLDYDNVRVSLLYVLNVDSWCCRISTDIFHSKIIYHSTIDISSCFFSLYLSFVSSCLNSHLNFISSWVLSTYDYCFIILYSLINQ